jgi:hypothetical protein
MTNKGWEFLIESPESLQELKYNEGIYLEDVSLDHWMSAFNVVTNVLEDNGISYVLKVNGTVYMTYNAEFSIFMEYVADLADFANRSDLTTYKFDFYEQGINYSFELIKAGNNQYTLVFTNLLKETFEPVTVKGCLFNLNLDLYTFFTRFVFLTGRLCPIVSKNEIYIEWKADTLSKFRL